jgi:hypothetical protein
MLFQFSALDVNSGRLYRERNNDNSTVELMQIFQDTYQDITIPVHVTDRLFPKDDKDLLFEVRCTAF